MSKEDDKQRNVSFIDIVTQSKARKADVREKMAAVTKTNKSTKAVCNIAIVEIYNQLLLNEIVSSELLNLYQMAKKLPFYKHEIKHYFTRIEKRRKDYEHYVRGRFSTNDGYFVAVAELYEEAVQNELTMIFINVKQLFDKNVVDYSAFRSKMELVKFLLHSSMEIYISSCAASELATESKGEITNKFVDFSEVMWMVCRIEEMIGLSPRINDENSEKSAGQLLDKIVLGTLAMQCFDQVRKESGDAELPEWFPKMTYNKDFQVQ